MLSLKVLQIVVSKKVKGDNSSVTGPERRSANLAHQWQPFGIEPVICYPQTGSLMAYFERAELKIIDFELKGKFDFKAILTLRKIIRQNHIQVVHTQGAAALDLIAAVAAKLAGVKMVVTRPVMICDQVHYSKQQIQLYEWIDQLTMRITDVVIAVSEAGADTLLNRYKVKVSKIKMVHNGVDLKKFHPKQYAQSSKENSPIIFGMVAHLSPFKGWYDYIQVIYRIKEKTNRPIKGYIIGDGVMRQELEEEVTRLGLESTIIFAGYIDNVRLLLGELDVFLFTSHREGLSVAILEALASALPVVATHVGGIKEQVTSGENGFIHEVGAVDAMADSCLRLIEDGILRAQMGKRSRTLAEERFSEQRMLREYAAIYQELAK